VSEHPGVIDNLFLSTSFGLEKPPGEDSTWFGTLAGNWAVPLTPPDGVALALQLGTSIKVRDFDPEVNLTFGGFARNFDTFPTQQGTLALLVDFRHTAFQNGLWAFRPIIATTLTADDSVGVEVVASLNREHRQEVMDQFNLFWTRSWGEDLVTELGVGYQFSHVDELLLRGRVAFGLTRYIDMTAGIDLNTDGNYAIGTGVSYHFGGDGRELYTPLPAADYPVLFHHSAR
jgi:hypothetical protein